MMEVFLKRNSPAIGCGLSAVFPPRAADSLERRRAAANRKSQIQTLGIGAPT